MRRWLLWDLQMSGQLARFQGIMNKMKNQTDCQEVAMNS
jgi:hypothetical protein